MADTVKSEDVKAGQQITGTVTTSGIMPEKKDAIAGLTSFAAAGALKWFEITSGINISIPWEIAFITFAVTVASYFATERMKSGFSPTVKDYVVAIATAIATAAIKSYETASNLDLPAEYEPIIIATVVTIASSFVPTKNVTIDARALPMGGAAVPKPR